MELTSSFAVTAYSEVFSLDHLPAFVTFYVFTASIMHVTVCEWMCLPWLRSFLKLFLVSLSAGQPR
jgi:hypothetical protein